MRNSKNILFALAIASAWIAAGCNGDATTDPGAGLGTFTGNWDDEPWNGRGYAVLVSDTLILYGHRRPVANVFYDEEVFLKIPFTGNGLYQIHAQARLGKVTGGDAGYFAAASGELLVESVDLTARHLEARLELEGNGEGGVWRFDDGVVSVPIYFDLADRPSLY